MHISKLAVGNLKRPVTTRTKLGIEKYVMGFGLIDERARRKAIANVMAILMTKTKMAERVGNLCRLHIDRKRSS